MDSPENRAASTAAETIRDLEGEVRDYRLTQKRCDEKIRSLRAERDDLQTMLRRTALWDPWIDGRVCWCVRPRRDSEGRYAHDPVCRDAADLVTHIDPERALSGSGAKGDGR